jgi:predicted dinucleotide-binding enzyme
VEELIQANAAQLDGKIIIDAANRMGGGGPLNSLATFKSHAPHAQVFRAFNAYGWENFANPVYNGIQADLFYSGPDGAARQTVEQLIEEIGLRPIRLGDAEQAGLVDSVLTLWFTLVQQGKGRNLAFKLLTR